MALLQMGPNIYENIFYIVASLAIIIITAGMVLIFKEVIPLFRNLHLISTKVREKSNLLIEYVSGTKTRISRIINKVLKLINFTKK